MRKDNAGWLIPMESHEALSMTASDMIMRGLEQHPESLVCAAAGRTPTRTYELLVQKKRSHPQWFDRMLVVKLDEWGGLEMNSPGTCETYLQQNLIQPLGITPDRYIAFESAASDPEAECKRIQDLVAAHRAIDLCILGLGANGHLGLNEPSESLEPFTHVSMPAESTLKHSMLKETKVRPQYGLTLGMADILSSRKILLLVSGRHKREQLERLRSPKISTHFPASFLWLHPDAICLYADDSIQGE